MASNGHLICIKRGETGYYPSEWDTGDKERNVEMADVLNEKLGVTPAQRQAMEIGSMAGWDVLDENGICLSGLADYLRTGDIVYGNG